MSKSEGWLQQSARRGHRYTASQPQHSFITYPGVVWPNSGLNVAGITMGLDSAYAASTSELAFSGTSNV
ncbi:MAG: hypothetical protein VKJ64_20220 [Leptolyngbyaceae bacterium]|nr:hypothetical protein [Leptolyngbyaceae bacterium]